MNCTRTSPQTHWTNVGYTAARMGLSFDEVRVPDRYACANEWIKAGFEKWQRKVAREAKRALCAEESR